MMQGILAVLVTSVLTGVAAGAAAGRLPAIGAFALVAAAGSLALMLRGNHREGRELERGLVPVRIDRVVGDDARARIPPSRPFHG